MMKRREKEKKSKAPPPQKKKQERPALALVTIAVETVCWDEAGRAIS